MNRACCSIVKIIKILPTYRCTRIERIFCIIQQIVKIILLLVLNICLHQVGFTDFRLFSFSKLVESKLTYSDLFGMSLDSSQTLSMSKENLGLFARNGQRVVGKVGLGDAITPSSWVPGRLARALRSSSTFRAIWSIAREFPLIVAGPRELVVPRAIAEELRRKFNRLAS